MLKSIVLFLFVCTGALAQCSYSVVVRLDPADHVLNVWADVNSTEPISFSNIGDYPIRDLDRLQEKLEEGVKSASFEYRAYDEELIGKDFVMLLGGWLPRTGQLCSYKTRVIVPKGFEVVVENEQLSKRELPELTEFIFAMNRPIDDITVIASSRFEPKRTVYNGIEILTYFFRKDAHLAQEYMNKTIGYIKMYESLIGPFPYSKFAVVENTFQTASSMPTFTLVGDHLIDKPYMVERSLAHEILHQWFGNAVFNDFAKGNWCEGLTTYLSDHYVQERNGSGAAYRKKALNTFMDSVTPEIDFPLAKFYHRNDRATMSIGYDKGMFFFHMLRVEMGEELFFSAIKALVEEYRSKMAGYNEMISVFSRFAGKDMSPFFSQWLYNTGMIGLEIENLSVTSQNGRYALSFATRQHNKKTFFTFPLSFTVICRGEETRGKVHVEGMTQTFELDLGCRPERVVFDPDYDLFRGLSKEEKIITLGTLERAGGFIVVGADKSDEALLGGMFDVERFIPVDALTPEMLGENIIFANGAKKEAHAATDTFDPYRGDLMLQVVQNPRNAMAVYVLLEYKAQELAGFATRMKYYKAYAKIATEGGRSTMKKTMPSTDGIVFELAPME